MMSFEAMDELTVNIAVSASSQSVQIVGFSGGEQIRVMNNVNGTVWIRFGASGLSAAAATSIPIPAGAVEVFSAGEAAAGNLYAYAICPSGTGSIYFTPGNGI